MAKRALVAMVHDYRLKLLIVTVLLGTTAAVTNGFPAFSVLNLLSAFLVFVVVPGIAVNSMMPLRFFGNNYVTRVFFVLSAGMTVAMGTSVFPVLIDDFSPQIIILVSVLVASVLLLWSIHRVKGAPDFTGSGKTVVESIRGNWPFWAVLLILLLVAYVLRISLMARFPIWTDRFTSPFRYIIDVIMSTHRFGVELTYYGSYAAGIYQVMRHPTAILLTAEFSILSGLSPDTLNFIPFGYLVLMPLALLSLAEALIPGATLKLSWHSLILVFAVLFVPDSILSYSMNPTSGGTALLGGFGWSILVFVILVQKLSLEEASTFGSAFSFLAAAISLTAYRTTGLLTIVAFITVTILIALRSGRANRATRASLAACPLLAMITGIYTQFLNPELIPSSYTAIITSVLLPSIPLWLALTLIAEAALIVLLIMRKAGLSIRIESRRALGVLILGAVVFGGLLLLPRFAAGTSSSTPFLHPSYLTINPTSILRIIEYALLAAPSLLWAVLYLTGRESSKLAVSDEFTVVVFLSVVGLAGIVFGAWGGLVFFVGRVPFYLSLLMVPLSCLVILRLPKKKMQAFLLVLFIVTPAVLSCAVFTSQRLENVGSITFEEYHGIREAMVVVAPADLIYTDQRIANAIMIMESHLYVEGPNPTRSSYSDELEDIFYTTNVTLAHQKLTSLYARVKYLMISIEFTRSGLFDYDYLLRPLSLPEYEKFLNPAYFIPIYNDGTIALLEVA